ncbi:MAG: D-alanyl-D-alanine carboxypeptidase [Alphaproteobacteria bacterium]|nr:D-alanyl-D-alanine carboxypeptidase [Alphaproteobacteria bacterium]
MMRPLLLAAVLLVAAPAAYAQSAFETEATHAVIMDHETGEILFSKNGSEPMAPSSMSKLMTALMVFEALERGELSLEDTLPVSEEAWRRGGAASGSSTMFLDVNSRASVEDLLRGIIVQSGNDACIVVAEALGGTEANFADMMTERAHELGLASANFVNATGWPDEDHVISAADLARLAQHIIEAYPQFYDLYNETEFTYNGIRQFNRNPLLGLFDGADGLKTGHTSVAGYGLVASAQREGERRIVVFNGMDSQADRADEAERLMRAAFSQFEIEEVVAEGREVGEAEVYLGTASTVPLRTAYGLTIGGHRRDLDEMNAEIVYFGPLTAPVTEGDLVGRLEISLPDGRTRSVDLVAAQSVDRLGLFGRAGSALASMLRGG